MKAYLKLFILSLLFSPYIFSCATINKLKTTSNDRIVTLSRNLYINTSESRSGTLQGVTWKWLDDSKEERVAVVPAGEKVVLESSNIEGGGIFSGYTTFKCRSTRDPNLRFNFIAGVDGKIEKSSLPW